MPESNDAPGRPASREVIHCAKCDAENLAGAARCHECGAHLYRVCRQCGRSTVRTERRCAHCGARLGRSAWQRVREKLFRRFSLWELAVGLVLIALAVRLLIGIIHFLFRPPPPPPDESEYNQTVEHVRKPAPDEAGNETKTK